jgi:hypothetical protein
MLKKIKIINSLGCWVTVWAWVDGVFAIHKSLETDFTQYRGNEWTVTHVPTGMCYTVTANNLTKHDVYLVLQDAKNFTWRGEKILESYQACELLNVVPLAQKEMGFTPSETSQWVRDIRPLVEKAHACKREEDTHVAK